MRESEGWFKELGTIMVESEKWFKENGARMVESEKWFKEIGARMRESGGWFKETGAKKKWVRFDLKKLVRKRKTSVNHLKIENMKVKCT